MPRKVKKETPVEKLQKQISELQEQLQIEKRKETEQKIKKVDEGVEKERKHLVEDLHFEDYALFERDYLHFSRIEIFIPIGYLYREYTESVVRMINLSFNFSIFGPSVGTRQEELPVSIFIKKLSKKDWFNYKTVDILNKILSYNAIDLATAVTDKTVQELIEAFSLPTGIKFTNLSFCSESCKSLFSSLNEYNKLKEELAIITGKKADIRLKEKEIFIKPHEETDEIKVSAKYEEAKQIEEHFGVTVAVIERLIRQDPIYYQDEDGEMYYMGEYSISNNTINFTLPDEDHIELRWGVELPLNQYKKSFWFKEDKSE